MERCKNKQQVLQPENSIIHVLGMGPSGKELLTLKTATLIASGLPIYARTLVHPAAQELLADGLPLIGLDNYYQDGVLFEEVYLEIVDFIMKTAKAQGEIIYLVPGHPCVAEKTVELLFKVANENGVLICLEPAMSFLDTVFSSLKIDPVKGILLVDAFELANKILLPDRDVLITQIYNRKIASDVKLSLMEFFPDEHEVVLIRAAGVVGEECIQKIPLFELDQVEWIDHLTSLYIPVEKALNSGRLEDFLLLMDSLLGENGCPWDKEQTHKSMRRYLIEEAYEVLEAIDEEDSDKLQEELGDVLLQVVFHSKLAEQQGEFTIKDIIRTVANKMIYRHPHVFGKTTVANASEVLSNWEKLKMVEKKNKGNLSVMDIPIQLPALMRAEKVQKKAAKHNFDWENIEGPKAKLQEEITELLEAIAEDKPEHIFEELGDVLFSLVNMARFLSVDPEDALQKANDKFIKRFKAVEEIARENGTILQDYSLEELDIFWDRVKKNKYL
ncbi:MAG: nucleoside triphosphate pyrophosphohydrolase [Clostridia bacterium]